MSDPQQPDPQNPFSAPVKGEPVVPGAGSGGDSTGGVIPYKNPKALIAYYLGIFSLLIFPLAIPAIILGILGLMDRKRNPEIKGSVHAWVGIVLGSLAMLCGVGLVASLLFGITRTTAG